MQNLELKLYSPGKTRMLPPVGSKITRDLEAHILATVPGPPPEGHVRWTRCLLTEHGMESHISGLFIFSKIFLFLLAQFPGL